MRSRLTKLLTAVVPVFAALVMAAGPASATPASAGSPCNPSASLLPAPLNPSHHNSDVNGDGLVCLQETGNGNSVVHDDHVGRP
jgi:hypothetical protein